MTLKIAVNCYHLYCTFADDTTISCSNSCLRTLNNIMQTEINKVSEWLNVNKLSLNIKKLNSFYLDLQIRNLNKN